MKPLLFSILVIASSVCCLSQITPEVQLGDSYEVVLEKIQQNPSYHYYSISKSKDAIRVTIKSNSGLDEASMHMYQFKVNSLFRDYEVMSTNPEGTWRTLYQMGSEQNGEPFTAIVGKLTMRYWKLEPKPRGYFYFAYSEWFRTECLFLVFTNEKFEAVKKLKIRLLK